MRALDTNVLVRFLVEDDRAQSTQAAAVLSHAVTAGESLFISDVVLCELVWVLSTSYRISRANIIDILNRLLKAKHLAFASSDQLARAIAAFASGKGDFADYVIREHALARGYHEVITFDRALLKQTGFVSP